MQARWLATLKRTAVPQVDLSAQSRLLNDEKTTRQFWPEFSQSAYDAAFKAQEVFGDYTDPSLAKQGKLRVKSKQREGMIALISELHKKKMYRKETLFIAFGLLDRFLSRLVYGGSNKQSFDLV